MKASFVFVVILIALSSSVQAFWSFNTLKGLVKGDSGGGVACAGCGIAITLLEQLSLIHDKSVDKVLDEVCGYFPPEFASICTYFVNEYGTEIIALVDQNLNPDQVCLGLNLCTDPTCQLHPSTAKPYEQIAPIIQDMNARMQKKVANRPPGDNPWDWLLALINKLAQKHEPFEDFDGDFYSISQTLRGSYWRGRDCNDFDSAVHAGRYNPGGDPAIDWNCNGISGQDDSGNSWDDLLCGDSEPMGMIVLGDSGGAHFSIPPSYMNASEINETTYDNLLEVLATEFDWPQRSGYTGFEANETGIPIDSVYKRLRQRNLCNHRDYQNCAVNGANSGGMASDIVYSINRNQSIDNPALVFFELIGNDVCHPEHSLEVMTTPEQFVKNVLKSLNYLDQQLPKGSHVVFVGLADGRVLWDTLHNRTHPIGVEYHVVYDYLNCLELCPCWVWMNSNETLRNAGSQRAAELSAMYPQIIANYTFNNFDMAYYDFPFPELEKIWVAKGGQTWELIEPIDGFHPNQIAHSLMAEVFWNNLERDHPEFLGPENPNNDQIFQLFGDQGGY